MSMRRNEVGDRLNVFIWHVAFLFLFFLKKGSGREERAEFETIFKKERKLPLSMFGIQ